MADDTCSTCTWYESVEGRCHRHPPVYIDSSTSEYIKVDSEDDFCGEYRD